MKNAANSPTLKRIDDWRSLGKYSALDPLGERPAAEVARETARFFRAKGRLAAVPETAFAHHIGEGRSVRPPAAYSDIDRGDGERLGFRQHVRDLAPSLLRALKARTR